MSGKETVMRKTKWWGKNHDFHSAEVTGPFPRGDDRFAVLFNCDITNKLWGQRHQLNEVAVYTVANKPVVREAFFYNYGWVPLAPRFLGFKWRGAPKSDFSGTTFWMLRAGPTCP